jgi:hypothetical protein
MDRKDKKTRRAPAAKSVFALPVLAGITVLAVLIALRGVGVAAVSPGLVLVVRWIVTALFVGYAVQRRSLTTWIIVSMVVGAGIGYDIPAVAVNLRIFSQIFLRMIKTIIAPLLFSTLVVGIAGHSDLKQVGRMGIKSLAARGTPCRPRRRPSSSRRPGNRRRTWSSTSFPRTSPRPWPRVRSSRS